MGEQHSRGGVNHTEIWYGNHW